MRAVAYLRVEEAASEAAQTIAIETWARRESVEIESWQIDVGIDGAVPIAERPGLVAAYRAIRASRAGILVAANAERFTRDELVAWLIERAALTEGAAIHTADGTRVAAASARLDDAGWTRGALDLARAYDRVMQRAALGAHVRASLATKKARGERVGTIPYGHRLSADGLHLEPEASEQAVIGVVCELSGKGLSQRAIVKQLAFRRIVGRTGAPLGQTQVANILRTARK